MFGLFERTTETGIWPIGIDIGSTEVKLVQATRPESGEGMQVLAATALTVPAGGWRNPTTMMNFFRSDVRLALTRGGFRGKRAVVALPAAHTYATRLRCPSMDRDQLALATARAGCDWIPFPPEAAAMRHLSAGDVYDREAVHQEVITLAVHRGVVRRCLDAVEAAKLDVVSVTPEPLALLATMGDPAAVDSRSRLVVDLGHASVRAYIVRAGRLRFTRSINVKPLADDATAAALKISGELQMCVKYFESTFATSPVTELIFTGGASHDRALCRSIAESVLLPARVHNPLARIAPANGAAAWVGEKPEAARRFAVAFGLSLSGIDSAATRREPALA